MSHDKASVEIGTCRYLCHPDVAAEILRLRAALAYYADPKSWERVCIERSSFEQYQPSVFRTDAHVDAGTRARAALTPRPGIPPGSQGESDAKVSDGHGGDVPTSPTGVSGSRS